MRMDRLTSKFQMALADAQSLAVGRDHQFIEPAHLLTALLGLYKARKIHRKGQTPAIDEELADEIGKANLQTVSRRVYKIHHNVEKIMKELSLSKNVLLPCEFIQGRGPHPCRQRLSRRRLIRANRLSLGRCRK